MIDDDIGIAISDLIFEIFRYTRNDTLTESVIQSKMISNQDKTLAKVNEEIVVFFQTLFFNNPRVLIF
jgi:hypothetical protein